MAESIIERQSELEHEVIEHILEEKELLTRPQKRKFYEIIVEQFSWGGLGVHDLRAAKPSPDPGQSGEELESMDQLPCSGPNIADDSCKALW